MSGGLKGNWYTAAQRKREEDTKDSGGRIRAWRVDEIARKGNNNEEGKKESNSRKETGTRTKARKHPELGGAPIRSGSRECKG